LKTGSGEEAAEVILFFASPFSDYVSGRVIPFTRGSEKISFLPGTLLKGPAEGVKSSLGVSRPDRERKGGAPPLRWIEGWFVLINRLIIKRVHEVIPSPGNWRRN
jgi:hypothetical protein